MWANTLSVALGGAVGSVLRFWLSLWLGGAEGRFPWATLIANASGSFAIGLLAALILPGGPFPAPPIWRHGLMAGLLGGYTTFSAFSLQSWQLAVSGEWSLAGLNIAASFGLCLLAVALGYGLGQAIRAMLAA